ncbi:MAG: UDP-N-acetylmuramoyl-tripeptide--D-alanyl-D-alanine ligase [Actinobacteria bacterium]|nr:UDP-N-acetylmuramoyl-tripeptide--D-alanyl-D-alanine ligase [Actinomycetota bacterium]
MISISAAEIAEITGGQLFGSREIIVCQPPSFDSRTVVPGSLFLALKGEFADGHNFASDAIANGAVLVLASRRLDVPCIVVDDVVAATGTLAKYVRSQLPSLIVIGITGSQGKTTTKDLLSAILRLDGETIATEASFNNELGLPITLMRCLTSTKYCVLEMGARHQGDIAALCDIAQPNIGVVLCVGNAHVGEFGSREKIALAKAELVLNLAKDGVAILGTYDEFTPHMTKSLPIKTITFGEGHDVDIRATDIDVREGRAHFDLVTREGRSSVALRLVGAHQVPNALAAAAVCTVLKISTDVIAVGLSTAEITSKWRMEIHEEANLLLINDSYNANPESMLSALKTLALFAQERGGQSWAFLGRMHELGESSTAKHASVGKEAEDLGIDHLVLIDAPEFGLEIATGSPTSVHKLDSKDQAMNLAAHFSHGDVILVKASRAEKLEVVALELLNRWREKNEKEEKAGGEE